MQFYRKQLKYFTFYCLMSQYTTKIRKERAALKPGDISLITDYSKKLNKVVMMREAPDHSKEDFVLLSGTAVREMLGEGKAPPKEFSRPEVAQILMDHYRS